MLRGVRGRVTAAVLAITAVLYSVLGAVGFIRIAEVGRENIRERVEQELDRLQAGLRSNTSTVEVRTADGIWVRAIAPDAVTPREPGEIRVERPVQIDGRAAVLVGSGFETSLTSSLRSLFRVLWIGIPIASIVSALLAGLATARALRPVHAITELAATIGASGDGRHVPVPETDDEIEHLAVTVNEMLDRIDRSRIAQRQFTSDAAHELRTPLMAIQGELELARTTLAVDDPGLPERLDALLERLRVRIDDLVLLSTLDEGRPPATEPFSARALADEEARTVGADVHGVDVEIVADRSLVEHALGNLLGNARRHARERVDLTVRVDSGRVWFDVDDDGPGIAPADREHLFRRFARLDEARTIDRGGAGLGLAIVASVAAAHDGGVDVATSPGGGARLSLWLPIAGAAAD